MQKNIKFIYGVLIVAIIGSILVSFLQNKIGDTFGINKKTETDFFTTSLPFIHPFCFGTDERFVAPLIEVTPGHDPSTRASEINISDCNKKARQYKYEKDNEIGGSYYIKADYPKIDGYQESSNAWVKYKVIGQTGNQIFVVVQENGGGSLVFEEILVLKKEKNILKIMNTISSDYTGMTDAKFKDGNINYTSVLAPLDILNLTESDLSDVIISGLESSHVMSVFGIASHNYNVGTKKDTITVNFISDMNKNDYVSIENGHKYQGCFNNLFKDYVAKKKTELTMPELSVFNQKFLDLCVK